jgi:hypothetical protein
MGDPLALAFIQPTPDADRFIDRKGIVKAGPTNHAGGTDRFRLELPLETLMAVLGALRREEDFRMRAATGCSQLP